VSPHSKTPRPSPIEVFIGQMNPAVSHIYVRWHASHAEGAKLTGSCRGPICRHARCLPFTAQFSDQGLGSTPLAKVTVPDACSWTPDFPALYRIEMELRDGDGQVIDTAGQWFGLRPIVACGRNLVSEGRRTVLRGVALPEWSGIDNHLRVARDLRTALITTNPNAASCEAASREGVILVVRLDCAADQMEWQLRQLSRWPAVTVIRLRNPVPQLPISQLAPQVLIGQEIVDPGEEPVADWADLVICHLTHTAQDVMAWMRQVAKPCMALRAGHADDIAGGRRACDQLQRELAGQIELAGYLIDRETAV